MPGVQLTDRHHHRCRSPRRAGPARMPLLPLVGLRRRLGARQRLLAPQLTVVGRASALRRDLVSSTIIDSPDVSKGSFAGWCDEPRRPTSRDGFRGTDYVNRIVQGTRRAGRWRAVSSTDCGSANRPVRAWVESWSRSNARALLCELLGYLRTNSGGLHEVPSVREQIVEPDLQSFDASGVPRGP